MNIKVEMTRKALFQYLLSFTVKSFSGIFGALVGVVLFALGFIDLTNGNKSGNGILYIFFGLFLVVYTPYLLWASAGKQLKKNFSKPLVYTFEDQRILVEMDEQQAEYQWKDMVKVTRFAGNVLVHTGGRNAFILPMEAIGEQYETLVSQLKKCMGEDKVKIK